MTKIKQAIVILATILICIYVFYYIYSHNDKVYIDDILTQEEISEVERNVIYYVRNSRYIGYASIEDRKYDEKRNVYNIVIKGSDNKIYQAVVDLNRKGKNGKYNNFEILEK